MRDKISMNANPIVKHLKKHNSEFSKQDLIKFCEDKAVEMVKFLFVGGDGKLKSLNFMITSRWHLDEILSYGERVDGSCLFSFIEAQSSDLYVIPRYSTAFVDPFSEIKTLALLCNYYTKDGKPLESAPEYIVTKASNAFKQITGMDCEMLGELEYYVKGFVEENFVVENNNYQESTPFTKYEDFRLECMRLIAQTGGLIKYGHTENGAFEYNGHYYEQNEIEFMPASLLEAADQIVIAKWVIRNLAFQYGLEVSFAPKVAPNKPESRLHIHIRLMKNGKNQMLRAGKLSSIAKTAIAGMMECAGALTAFGNPNPLSYVKRSAGVNICWGERNRSALLRVPLGWSNKEDMAATVNNSDRQSRYDATHKQTIEFRSPNGSSNIHFLAASMAIACRHGFEMQNALENANKTFIDVDISKAGARNKIKELKQLPISCWESAEVMDKQRHIFENYGVFSPGMLDGIIKDLKQHDDKTLNERIEEDPELLDIVLERFFHCG